MILWDDVCVETYSHQFKGLHVHLYVLTFVTQQIKKVLTSQLCVVTPGLGTPGAVFVQWAATCNQHKSQSYCQLMAPQPTHSTTYKCKLYIMILLDYGLVVCDTASLSVSWHFERMPPLPQGFKGQGTWTLEDAGDTFFQDIRNHPAMLHYTLEDQNPH